MVDYDMSASRALLNAVHENSRNARSIAAELSDLAHCFSRTGNDRVAEQLGTLAADIIDAAKVLDRAYSGRLMEESAETAAEIGSVFKALLTATPTPESSHG